MFNPDLSQKAMISILYTYWQSPSKWTHSSSNGSLSFGSKGHIRSPTGPSHHSGWLRPRSWACGRKWLRKEGAKESHGSPVHQVLPIQMVRSLIQIIDEIYIYIYIWSYSLMRGSSPTDLAQSLLGALLFGQVRRLERHGSHGSSWEAGKRDPGLVKIIRR